MTDHYYSKNPQAKENPRTWQTKLRGKTYTFHTDDGVFSKHKIDFGTKLLVETFRAPSISGDILDLGCGYGAIGLALADDFPERKILMVDVNKRAISLARKNLQEHSIKNAEVLYSDGFSRIKDCSFASIVTNPPIRAGKKIVHQWFEKSKKVLKKKGTLWIVIQKKQGAPSAQRKLEEIFPTVEIITRKKGYYIICAFNT